MLADPQRRLFLRSIAGVTTVMAIGPLSPSAGRAASPVFPLGDPWAAWSPEALRHHHDPRLRAIAHAILAPNPQNLQPWVCELHGDNYIILRNGGERRLAASDMPDRQLTVEFGTFSELLIMAAEAEGYAVEMGLFPEGEPWPVLDYRPIAIFTLHRQTPRRDPLLDHILERHTNRTPFDLARSVSIQQLTAIRKATRKPERVHLNLEPGLATKIQDITMRAWDVWMISSPSTRLEVARVTHIGNIAIAAAPYGPYVSDTALKKAAGPITFETLSDPNSVQFKANRTAYRRAIQTGLAHLWIVAPQFDRKGMFDAGRDWVRAHLQAIALGLDMEPHSQALQDFPEIVPYVDEMHNALGVSAPARIHMLGRIGYGSAIGPAPRLPVEAHLQS